MTTTVQLTDRLPETEPEYWEGWYWQACFPGCLPDGDVMGPFESESDAMSDANCVP